MRSAILLILAALTAGAQDFSHTVRFDRTVTANGDTIRLQEIRGPSDKWVKDAIYEVRGTYTLVSHEKAVLGAFATTPPGQKATQDGAAAVMTVTKGSGEFRLRFRLWWGPCECTIGLPCLPGVSFYPSPGGESFLRAEL